MPPSNAASKRSEFAEINVHADGGGSFLFHAVESKTVKRGAGEKFLLM
jgi:hypothetical protein